MITSRQNPLLKKLISLLEPRFAKKHGQCLVAGRKIVAEVLERVPESEIIASAAMELPPELTSHSKIILVQKDLFKLLDVFGTRAPLLLTALPSIAVWTSESPAQGLELFVSLQDPSNLGAVLRSAEAFGASKVVLLKESAFAFHPKAVRASSGSCFRLPLFKGPSIQDLSVENLVGLDLEGASLPDFKWSMDVRLLIGEEGRGIPEALMNITRVRIPTTDVESLNATVAASIALYDYRNKIGLSQ